MRIAAVVLGASLLATAAPAVAGPARTYSVVIDKMKFGAMPVVLHRGDKIVWVNRDLFLHSATAANHSFDVNVPPGKSAAIVLKSSGVIAFSCKYHPGMRGQLRVQP